MSNCSIRSVGCCLIRGFQQCRNLAMPQSHRCRAESIEPLAIEMTALSDRPPSHSPLIADIYNPAYNDINAICPRGNRPFDCSWYPPLHSTFPNIPNPRRHEHVIDSFCIQHFSSTGVSALRGFDNKHGML